MEWPAEPRELLGGWALSETHSASSYGHPVLVSPEGDPFGPSDLLGVSDVAEMRGVPVTTLHPNIVRRSKVAGPGWMRVGRKSGWAIFAADAVRL